MTDETPKDYLDQLLTPKRKTQHSAPITETKKDATEPIIPQKQETKPGISALDLLTLPADQSKVISFICRKKQASFEEICVEMHQDAEIVQKMLNYLADTNQIMKLAVNGELYYKVAFHSHPRRSTNSAMSNIWSRVDPEQPTGKG